MSAIRLAAIFLAVSGVLHFVAAMAAGFAADALPLIPVGLLYVALAYFLNRRGSRVLSWIVFLMMITLSAFALGKTGGASSVPDPVTYAIVIFDWLCAACLFVVLWRSNATSRAAGT